MDILQLLLNKSLVKNQIPERGVLFLNELMILIFSDFPDCRFML